MPVDRTNLLLQLVDRARFKAAPHPVLALGGVQDDIVRVQLRVLRAAGAVLETGNDKIAGRRAGDGSVVADARCRHMLLDMGERGFDRCAMRGNQAPVARDLSHDRHRLGRTQRDIPSWTMFKLAVAGRSQLLAGDLAVEQVAELLAVNIARQAKFFRALALPFGRRKAVPGIIVIGFIIARGLARTGECGNRRHHYTGPSPGGGGAGAGPLAICCQRVAFISPAMKPGCFAAPRDCR